MFVANFSIENVIEANLKLLSEMRLSGRLHDEEARIYSEIMHAFYESDVSRLESFQGRAFHEPMELALSWRIDLKKKIELNADSVSAKRRRLDALRVEGLPLTWEAELEFILGEVSYFSFEFPIALECFSRAASLYRAAAMDRKALKCRFNVVATESCLEPEKRLFSQYKLIADEAAAIGETMVAGTATLNIAREFQKLGALRVALKHANTAIEFFAKGEPGSRNYHLGLLHRASILLDLDRKDEADLDLEEASTSLDPMVQESLAVLSRRLSDVGPRPCDSVVPVWREIRDQLEEGRRNPVLGDLEAEAIRVLAARPRTRIELMTELYGTDLDVSVLENRLKNLVNRIRKRHPGLVVMDEGRYRLVDDLAPTWLKGRAKR